MKLAKSLLLGSAASLFAVAGAQAADLPVRKAAPVEFVRVCTAYGAGFFFIPGTDTCLRVSGRARFEFQGVSQKQSNVSPTGFRTQGRLNLDARTQTAYGTLRTFIRFEMARRTGHHFSGTAQRRGEAEIATGLDFFNQGHTLVTLDKAFIQFAGLTAGRATSFFDFFGNDHVFFGLPGSARDSTNLLAYTATFGQGFSATISMEDPLERRYPLANGLTGGTGFATFGAGGTTNLAVAGATTTGSAIVPIALFGPAGNINGFFGQQQRNVMPDFVGTLRVDQAWGSAQLSGAVHQVSVGGILNPGAVATDPRLAGLGPSGFFSGRRPDDEYGYAVQGGVKLNLPFIAAGDNIYLQAAYAKGGLDYTVSGSWQFGSATGTSGFGGASTQKFNLSLADGIIDPFSQEIRLSESFSAVASFLHYWTPQVRQAFFGSYAEIDYPTVGGTAAQRAALQAGGTSTNAVIQTTALNSGFLRDFSLVSVGTNLIWSPVRDLDIGAEVMYDNVRINGSPVFDLNRCGGVAAGCRFFTRNQETLYGRLRIQRDF